MESLGKERDLDGNTVNQGLTVYGNKGSTDQHAYVQQLREGVSNFFVLFIQVLQDRANSNHFEVEPQITSGDYLFGFLLGTQAALFENNRQSLTLTLIGVSAQSVGSLIALFERAVGLYALYVNVNAYHQPGVEAGKKAAENVIALQRKVLSHLNSAKAQSAIQIGAVVGAEPETVFKICEHLAANHRLVKEEGANPFDARYRSM
jgi:glucose-6-phosphate isomerase